MNKTIIFIRKHPHTTYHVVYRILNLLAGIIFTFATIINHAGVYKGIFLSLGVIVSRTMAFLVYPMLIIAAGIFIKYTPTLGVLVWLILLIGEFAGEKTLLYQYGYLNTILLSAGLTSFGVFNFISVTKAYKENVGNEGIKEFMLP